MRILLTQSWSCRLPREPQTANSGSARRPARWASSALFESPGGAVGRENPPMFSLKWLQSRGAIRGKPGLPGGHGRRLAVLTALCTASLLQTGCQSGPFSPCGCIGRTATRFMRPFRNGGADACCGAEAGGCVSSGVPVESMAPGAMVVPGASAPSAVDTPQYLESVPKASPGPAPSSPTGRCLPARRRVSRPARFTRRTGPRADRPDLEPTTWRIPWSRPLCRPRGRHRISRSQPRPLHKTLETAFSTICLRLICPATLPTRA